MNNFSVPYSIKEFTLTICGVSIKFEFPISDYIEINSVLILLLDIPSNIKYNENVFGVSLISKKIIWQIPQIPDTDFYRLYSETYCSYIDMSYFENKLKLFNWCDFYIIIDEETGTILQKGDSK